MHPKIIAKKIIEFNKSNFDNTFDAVTVLLEHTEKMVGIFLKRATLFPDDGKELILNWLETYKKGRNDFKDTVDNNFKNVESLFACGSETINVSPSEATSADVVKERLAQEGAALAQKNTQEAGVKTKKKKNISGRQKTVKTRS